MAAERRWALGAFRAFGLFWGAWGAVLPAVQVSSGSTDGELGTALLMIGLGALVSMRLTGHLMTAGVHAEIRSQRPLMNLAHAWFSVGVVVASLNTAALRTAGAGPRVVLGAVFVLVIAITVVALASGSLRTKGESDHGTPSPVPELSAPRKWHPALPMIVFGCLGALAYLVENAWESWGAVYMETTLDAGAGLSSTAPAVFASAAAAGRFAGNAMARRFEPVRCSPWEP